jgi:hypothetical protein
MAYLSRQAQAAASRDHYLRNRKRLIEKKNANRPKYIARNKRIVAEHLSANPCVDCGEPDPVVLQFDHRDGETKVGNIADIVGQGKGLSVLIAEIRKCDVRCANCHQRREAKKRGSVRCLVEVPPGLFTNGELTCSNS